MRGSRRVARGGNHAEKKAQDEKHGGELWQRQIRVNKPLIGGPCQQFRTASKVALQPEAYRRAAAAVVAVRAEYTAKIEAVQKDRSLTPEQRAAAIMELRRRQKAATKAIKRRILDEERQLAGVGRVRALPRPRAQMETTF